MRHLLADLVVGKGRPVQLRKELGGVFLVDSVADETKGVSREVLNEIVAGLGEDIFPVFGWMDASEEVSKGPLCKFGDEERRLLVVLGLPGGGLELA